MKYHADRLLALAGSLLVHGIAVAAIVAYGIGDAKDAPPSPSPITMALVWATIASDEGTISGAMKLATESPSQADDSALDDIPSVPAIAATAPAQDAAAPVELASARQDSRPIPPKPSVAVRAKPTPSKPVEDAVQADRPIATMSGLTMPEMTDDSSSGNGTSAAPPSGQTADQPRSWSISSRITPAYPMTARRRGSEGEVALRVEVDQDGRPRRVAILRSSGDPQLDGAAAQAVEQWRFAVAAPMAIEIPIHFRLRADALAANQP